MGFSNKNKCHADLSAFPSPGELRPWAPQLPGNGADFPSLLAVGVVVLFAQRRLSPSAFASIPYFPLCSRHSAHTTLTLPCL